MLILICLSLSAGGLFPGGFRDVLALYYGDFSHVCTEVSRIHLPSGLEVWTPACNLEMHWLGFPHWPAGIRCPGWPQWSSASVPQAPFKSLKAARTRCCAGSNTPKSNSCCQRGCRTHLCWCPQLVCRCTAFLLLDLFRLVEFVGFGVVYIDSLRKFLTPTCPWVPILKKKKKKNPGVTLARTFS